MHYVLATAFFSAKGPTLGELSRELVTILKEAMDILATVMEKDALVMDPVTPSTASDRSGH